MKKVTLFFVALMCISVFSHAQQKRTLTLEETIQLARANSRSAKLAETQMTLGYWSFAVYKSQLRPQLLLRGTLPDFSNRPIQVRQEDGTFEFRNVNQNNSNLSLGLEQVLPWTNTTVSLDSRIARVDLFDTDVTQYQGDPFGLSITQPLFAVNPFKWDGLIEPLQYEQSKRQYVQDLEDASRRAASLFFQLLVEQKNLEIARQNESASDTINRVEQGRYNIGTSTEDQLLQTQLDLLTAQSDAQQAELDVQSRSLELRSFIGLTDDVELVLVPPSDVPDFLIDPATALQYAMDNRAEFLEFQISRLEQERSVAEARAARFNANLSASFGFSSNQSTGLGDVYDFGNNNSASRVTLTFALPILDGGRNRARMNRAREFQKLNDFNQEQNQINFEQEITNAVRNFDQIRDQIAIAKKREEIALKRFEITNGRYLAGKVGILDLTNARSGKDTAIRSYISALQQFWDAYYELRNLTLYDFQNRELLYNPLLEYDPRQDARVIKDKPTVEVNSENN